MFRSLSLASLAALAVLSSSQRASAANVLFVSNEGGDTNIVTVLRAEGHVVTEASGSEDLGAELSGYDVVFWSATGSYGIPSTAFANLTAYVSGGGRVFVTGYDSLISNTELATLCGGTGARDLVGSPGPGIISSVASSLTVGVIDIRGQTPSGGHTDRDGLTGLGPDTVEVTPSLDGGSSQWSIRTLGDGEIAWVSNGTYGGTHPSWEATGTGGAGAYNAAVRNFAFAADFATSEPGAPEISFEAPFTVNEGDPVELRAIIEDHEGDTYTFSWDLDDDGTFGENAGTATTTVAAGTTDGTSSMRVGVRAADASGHTATRYRNVRVLNVAPSITSEPPRVTSVGMDFRYAVVVADPAGPLDPIEYTLARGPSRMSITAAGVVQWTPGDSDVTLPGETVTIEVTVHDGDEGRASQVWEMTVSPNRRPSPPVPAFPIDNVAILDATPRLAAANAQDLDHDTLGYEFEIDTVETFDSADLRSSGRLEETPGFTAWELVEPLPENRLYFWRVWANDGTVDSEVRQSSFYVVRDPRLGPPDAGPGDGGPVLRDGGIIPGIDAGLHPPARGCSVGMPARSSAGWLVTALLGLALLRRRRR